MQCLLPVTVVEDPSPDREPKRPDPSETLSLCDAALLGLDAEGALLMANGAGWRVLERADTLAVRDGRPLPADPALAGPWRGALQAALNGRRRLLCSTRPQARAILVRPAPGGQGMRILVRLGPDETGRREALRAYAESVGLTGQETRVLEGLIDGQPPAVIAARHRVSLATIRTQIRMTVDKAGVHGVRGLLARVACVLQ
jgi:DNA-binding CsgD family transcriptional regulator